jgi:hypothetical protein
VLRPRDPTPYPGWSCWAYSTSGPGSRRVQEVQTVHLRVEPSLRIAGRGPPGRGADNTAKASYPSWASVTPMEYMAFDRHNTGPDHAGVERLSTRSPRARERAVEYRHSRRTNRFAQWDAGASRPSKPAPGRHEAIEAQIRYEIAVMQGVMICDLHQDEHLVRLDAPEVRPGH